MHENVGALLHQSNDHAVRCGEHRTVEDWMGIRVQAVQNPLDEVAKAEINSFSCGRQSVPTRKTAASYLIG